MIIWLSSYPRSGNTFLRTLLKSCLKQDTYSIYNDSDIGGDPGLTEVTGHRPLEHSIASPGFTLDPMRESETPFFVKTHELSRNLVERGDKVIYIIRDGREATLSFSKHLLNFYARQVSPLELSFGLDFPGGSWSDHVAGWNPKHEPDTLLLLFEEVTRNPERAVDQIASFAGLSVVEYRIPKFENLQKINPRFFRRGKHDSYKDDVSEEAQTLFWIRSFREMREYGYNEGVPGFVQEISDEILLNLGEGIRQGIEYLRRLRARVTEDLNDANVRAEQLRMQITSQREVIERKDQQITSQREVIERKDQQIISQREVIDPKDQEITSLRKAIERKDQVITGLQSALEDSDRSVALIRQSKSWKMTRPLRALHVGFLEGEKFWRILKARLRGQ